MKTLKLICFMTSAAVENIGGSEPRQPDGGL